MSIHPDHCTDKRTVDSFMNTFDQKYSAIVLAVSHNQFLELDIDLLKEEKSILFDIKGIKRFLIPLSPNLMMIPALFLERLPKAPFTVDQMKLLKHDNVLSGDFPGLNELGLEPADMKEELIKIYAK